MVILVTAIVILTMFWKGVAPATGLTDARSLCMTQLSTSCSMTGREPPTWNIQNIRVTENGRTYTTSCSVAAPGCRCNPKTKKVEGC